MNFQWACHLKKIVLDLCEIIGVDNERVLGRSPEQLMQSFSSRCNRYLLPQLQSQDLADFRLKSDPSNNPPMQLDNGILCLTAEVQPYKYAGRYAVTIYVKPNNMIEFYVQGIPHKPIGPVSFVGANSIEVRKITQTEYTFEVPDGFEQLMHHAATREEKRSGNSNRG